MGPIASGVYGVGASMRVDLEYTELVLTVELHNSFLRHAAITFRNKNTSDCSFLCHAAII